MADPPQTVADALVWRLRDHGIRHIFGYPGGQITPIYDALYREPAIRHILARDPQRAADALAEAERLGRQSLADIRRTVGLLQADRANGTSAPLPSAADIPTLVADYARAGLDVRLEVEGNPARLSSAAGLVHTAPSRDTLFDTLTERLPDPP